MADSSLRDDVLRVGRSVLDDPVDEDAKTLLVGQYVAIFERWYQEEGPGNPNALTTREHLESIQSLHTAVIEFALNLMEKTDKTLKGLRQRERSMLAYVDTLPKRVSLNKPQKG